MSSEEHGLEHFRGGIGGGGDGRGGGGGTIFSDKFPVDVVSDPLPSVDMGVVSVRQTFE